MKGHRWFIVHTISMNTKELKYIIEKKLQHPYVEKFVKKPFVDEDKLEILTYIYKHVQIPATIKQQHILTIMLVQIALDTHEQIPNHNQDATMQETEKQLAVLAGDYYSGLYYLLLSEIEEVNMIQVLASAIRKINEYKMRLFYEEFQSTHDLLDLIGEVESKLFTEVASYLGLNQKFVEVIRVILFLHRLEREEEADGILSNYLKTQNQDSTFQQREMYRMYKEKLETLLMQLPYQHLHFSHAIRHKFMLSYSTSVAEEG